MSEATRVEKVDMTNAHPLDPDAMFAALEEKITAGGVKMNMERVRAAYDMARQAHAGQLRKDGSP